MPANRGAEPAAALMQAIELAEASGGRVTALYVQTQVGEDAELLGIKVLTRHLERCLGDSEALVVPKVVLADSIREGVAAEACGHDLVLLGTANEWTGRRLVACGVRSHHLHGRQKTWTPRVVVLMFLLAAVAVVLLCFALADYAKDQAGM